MRSSRLFNRDLSVAYPMTTFLFAKGNVKTSLPIEFGHKYESGCHISKICRENCYVTKIAMTEKQMVQFDWRLISQKLRFAFLKYGGDTFTDRDWINLVWKGSKQTRFQYCQNSCEHFIVYSCHPRTRRRRVWSNLS